MGDETQRQAVNIDGIDYPITRVSELNQAELADAKRLFPRVAGLLTWSVLEEADADEADAILMRIVAIFLRSAPAEVRQRLSTNDRIRLLTPFKDQIVGDLEGGHDV
jgi:hypothetical protein